MKHKVRLKWGIFRYLLIFVGITLLLLWVLQINSLSMFYKKLKVKNIKDATEYICKNIEDDNIKDIVINVCEENEMYIMVIDENGEIKYSPDVIFGAPFRLPKEIMIKFILRMTNEKNEILQEINKNAFRSNMRFQNIPPNLLSMETPDGVDNKKQEHELNEKNFEVSKKDQVNFSNVIGTKNIIDDSNDALLYAKKVSIDEEKDYWIITLAQIIPVDATKQTLLSQLFIVTLIMIVIALILAFRMSKSISKSIENINDKSKEFSKGNYDVTFSEDSFQEIDELSKTLNFTAKELSKVDEIRREFLANVSHDLRTPLTMITGYSEVIRDIPGENTNENIQVVIDEAKRLTTLVNDLLDITKIEAGVIENREENYNLTKSIEDIIQRYSKMLDKNEYEIKFEYDEEINILADELRISQVIYNLLGNAVTHCGMDKLVIVRQTVEMDKVKIEVIDNGIGIEPEKIKDIWNRYYKVDKEHKRAQVGSGIGLSIVSQILKGYGSDYGVISEVGKGSNFWFRLNKVTK